MSDLLANDTITSRKVHRCTICGLRIPKGSKYQQQKMVDNGDFRSASIHLCCYSWARVNWNMYDWKESATWPQEEIRNDMPEELQELLWKLDAQAAEQVSGSANA
jgi:hypothetical protein